MLKGINFMYLSGYPKISIVTPSFNQGQFLEQTVMSVLGQNYPNLEYIIIDGGSTDNSVEIIKKYEKELAYWESHKDRGQTHAINKGFKRATGDIIAYLNSDDQYCPGVLLIVADYFLKHSNSMWLCGNVLYADRKGTVFAKKIPIYSPFILRFGSSSVYQPNIFLRRQLLDEVGYLREDFHTIMDQEWFCRIAETYPPEIVDNDFAIFRWHVDSKSSSSANSSHFKRYLVEKTEIYLRYLPVLRPVLRRAPKPVILFLNQVARGVKLWIRFKRLFKPISSHKL